MNKPIKKYLLIILYLGTPLGTNKKLLLFNPLNLINLLIYWGLSGAAGEN